MDAEKKWYVGALNDGLFITDQKPSPAGTDIPPEWGEGCGMALNVTGLSVEEAQAVVDAHNSAISPPASAAVVPEGIVIPAMNDDLRAILGMMCFQFIHIAHAWRRAGAAIETRAEAEQAYCLHWLLSVYAKHGSEWRSAADAELKAAIAATPSPPVGEKGEG